jgi:hypothetical protein
MSSLLSAAFKFKMEETKKIVVSNFCGFWESKRLRETWGDVVIALCCTQKKFRTHVIKLNIAPMSFPPGQYLLVSASNNMLYYLSQ